RRRDVVLLEELFLVLAPFLRQVAPLLRLPAELAMLEDLVERLADVRFRHFRAGPHVDQDVVARRGGRGVSAVEVKVRRARAMETVRELVVRRIEVFV